MGSYSTLISLQLITFLCILSIGDIIFCSNPSEVLDVGEDVSYEDSYYDADIVGYLTWKMIDKNKTVMELLPKLDGEIQDSWENTNPFYENGTLDIICNVSREYFEDEIQFKFELKNGTTVDAQQMNEPVVMTDSYTKSMSKESSIKFLDKNTVKLLCLARVINSTTWKNVSQEIVIELDPTWKMIDKKNKTVMELLPKFEGQIQVSWENTNPFYVKETLDIICNVSKEYFEDEIQFKFELNNGTIMDAEQMNEPVLMTDSYTNSISKESSIKFLDTNMVKLLCLARVINSTTWKNVSQEIVILPSFGPKLVNNTNQTIETSKNKFSLSCSAQGAPSFVFNWLKIENGNLKVTQGNGVHSTQEGEYEKTSIIEVDLSELQENSSDVYSCKASNIRSSDTRFFTVTRVESQPPPSEKIKPIQKIDEGLTIKPIEKINEGPSWLVVWISSIAAFVAVIIMFGTFMRWMLSWLRRRQDPQTEIQTDELLISEQPLAKNGQFGLIYEAKFRSSNKKAVVKSLREPGRHKFDDYTVHLFIQELEIFKRVGKHPNIVQYIGQVTKNRRPEAYMIVMKYYEQGDLLKHLQKNKPTIPVQQLNGYEDHEPDPSEYKITVPNPITQLQMIKWCKEVACGMEYLASKRIVHGDLAARNILLDSFNNELVAVVADFGLSKELLRKDDGNYTYKSSGRPLPVTLCSIEVLEDFVYSEDSDIWAFGVLMYEIFSYGQVPYKSELRDYLEEMDRWQNESEDASCTRDLLLEFLKSERRLSKPAAANDDVYAIMESCWARGPSQRPRFSELNIKLENILCQADRDKQVQIDIINESVGQ